MGDLLSQDGGLPNRYHKLIELKHKYIWHRAATSSRWGSMTPSYFWICWNVTPNAAASSLCLAHKMAITGLDGLCFIAVPEAGPTRRRGRGTGLRLHHLRGAHNLVPQGALSNEMTLTARLPLQGSYL